MTAFGPRGKHGGGRTGILVERPDLFIGRGRLAAALLGMTQFVKLRAILLLNQGRDGAANAQGEDLMLRQHSCGLFLSLSVSRSVSLSSGPAPSASPDSEPAEAVPRSSSKPTPCAAMALRCPLCAS